MANHDETAGTPANRNEHPQQEGGSTSAPGTDELDALRAEHRAQAQRIDELARAYAEALNDRESFRRRLEREKERQVEAAKADSVQLVLDAMEELRRASASTTSDADALAAGVRLIADGLQRRLESAGLVPIHAEGESFDPLLHEAVDLVPTADRDADGLVIEVVRGGWRIGDRMLRPARVRVARFAPQD